MTSNKPLSYRLKPKALEDLEEIWRYTAETWSLSQADIYQDALANSFKLIAGMPEVARERMEFDPPVRIHVHQSHLIVYIILDEHIEIVRVLGGRQDWHTILQALEI